MTRKIDGARIVELRVRMIRHLVSSSADSADSFAKLLFSDLGELLALTDLGRKVLGAFPAGVTAQIFDLSVQQRVFQVVARAVEDYEVLESAADAAAK